MRGDVEEQGKGPAVAGSTVRPMGSPRARNLRLRAAMMDRQVGFAELARATGRNLKTVQRWVYEGRVPRQNTGQAVARHLNIDANWLWPKMRTEINPDLINLYATVDEVPATIWTSTARLATTSIDIAADAAPAFPCDLAGILQTKARQGVPLRLCLSGAIASTVRIDGAWTVISPMRTFISIYRFDEEMLVWLNRAAFEPGCEQNAPVLHLRHREERGVFAFYSAIFAHLCASGEAVAQQGKDWYRAVV